MEELTPAAESAPIQVIHVDDAPDFARMVATKLEAESDRLRVEWTTKPASVADRVAEDPIDCVVSGYAMGDTTGLDVLESVRAIDPEMPFLLLTDTGSEAVASEAITAGISDYVTKRAVESHYELLARKITTHVAGRRANAAADRAIRRLRELTANTHDVLFIFAADWSELLYINEQYESLFGQSVATLRADPTSFLEPVHPEDVDKVRTTMERAAEGATQHVEYRLGEDRWVESHAEPITDEEGQVVRIAGFTHEITDRKQQMLALQAKNERLERSASIISHDLRNPLSVAKGYLGMARDEADSDHLATVESALDRMGVLIDEILTLAREGQDVTDTDPVGLAAAARASWTNIDQQEGTLVTETTATIQADELRLGQVFENLFRNALEHGGEDVTITVDTLENGFYIENDGEPIPEDKRDEVFETGFTTAQRGTGFGLAIIKRIVDAHGWEIRLGDDPETVRFEITGVEFVDDAH